MLEPKIELPEHLQRAEVEAALAHLVQDPGKMARAKKWAKLRAQSLRVLDSEDLLQEAFNLLLAGRRKWPRRLPTLVVLWGVLRSVAYDTRKKQDYVLADDLGASSEENSEDGPSSLTKGASTEADPANAVAAQSELEVVQNLVKGDENLELYVEALTEGLTGMNIAKELGWDAKKYDAVRKRLSRRLAALKKDRS